MRPGRLNPGKVAEVIEIVLHVPRFNEAGAIKPRKDHQSSATGLGGEGFNEAGAIKPRKDQAADDWLKTIEPASMRPGRLNPGK